MNAHAPKDIVPDKSSEFGSPEVFAGLLSEAGLDFRSAATLLAEPQQNIRLWFTGTEQPPVDAIWKLSKFAKKQYDMALQVYENWEKSDRATVYHFPVSTCDRAARNLGWPSRETQVVVASKAQILLAPVIVKIVPADTNGSGATSPGHGVL